MHWSQSNWNCMMRGRERERERNPGCVFVFFLDVCLLCREKQRWRRSEEISPLMGSNDWWNEWVIWLGNTALEATRFCALFGSVFDASSDDLRLVSRPASKAFSPFWGWSFFPCSIPTRALRIRRNSPWVSSGQNLDRHPPRPGNMTLSMSCANWCRTSCSGCCALSGQFLAFVENHCTASIRRWRSVPSP